MANCGVNVTCVESCYGGIPKTNLRSVINTTKRSKTKKESKEMREAIITGNWTWDGGSIALVEVEEGYCVAAEPGMANDLVTAHFEGEIVTIAFEEWQIV